MKIDYRIVPYEPEYLDDLTSMALDLWPKNEYMHLRDEFERFEGDEKQMVFLSILEDLPVGFIHVALRADYVEGADSSPVGYVEGIYVLPEFRKKGMSKKLLHEAEEWSKSKGCVQIASDIEDENVVSYAFHVGVGFKEVNRVICFIKNID